MSATCRTCGQEHVTRDGYPACVGHKRKTGAGCRGNRVAGTTLCSKHGGLAPQVRSKGAERVAAQKVARTLGELLAEHDKPDQHPYDALLEVTRGMGAVTRLVQQRLADLDTGTPDDETQAALAAYEKFARSFAAIAKTVLDARLEERMAQVEEAKITMLATALRLALVDAAVPPPVADAVKRAVAERLRALPTA
jgi:hypothetical protein